MTLTTYSPGQPEPTETAEAFLISDWDQGFSSPTEWQADNVYQEGETTFLQLDTGSIREPGSNQFAGAEVQSNVEATSGTWSWEVKAPEMVPGAIFGMFLFQADWANPRLEFDMEIVGDDPTKIEIVTHMAMADGRVQTVYRVVQLDFDPSADVNRYEISLTDSSATFMINRSVVATFDKEDFGGYWRSGEVRSYTNLWATQHSGWAGTIDPATLPIRAEILSSEWRPDVVVPDSWIGTSGADRHRGTACEGTLSGGDGADQLYGEAGADDIHGERGDDALYGWTGADRIYGGSGHDRLFGEAGNDHLQGGSGNDTLDGGAGSDTLLGSLGDDTYLLAAGGDLAREALNAGIDTVRAGYSYALGANIENLVLTGSANLNGSGNALANRLTGNAGSNVLSGGAGRDTLLGGAGNDRLNGGAENDRLDGGQGSDVYLLAASGDTVVEGVGAGTDTVQAGYSYALGANVENLVLTGTATLSGTGNALANRLSGNGAANVLFGGAGHDTFLGGGGADRLIGGYGADRLTGGTGNDSFQFNSLSERGDVLTDFGNRAGNNDNFRVSAAGFGGGLLAGTTLAASQFQSRSDNLAQDSNDRFIFRTTDKTLWFDADGRGGAAAVLVADLQAGAVVTAGDILLI